MISKDDMQEDFDELDGDDDAVSNEENLLSSVFSGIRVFVLNDVDHTNIFGVLLDETDDSFLVGLPSQMMESAKGVRVVPFVQVPYMRLLKSSVMGLIFAFGALEKRYTEYLFEDGKKLYPEIVEFLDNGMMTDEVPTSGYQDAEVQLKVESEGSKAVELRTVDISNISLSSEAKREGVVVQGMNDDDLRNYFTNKYNKEGKK